MENKLIHIVKHNRILYKAYYYVMSGVINFIKLFVKPDNKLFLFVVYGGKYYADSPKMLYEAMKSDPRFQDVKLVWGFQHPEEHPEVPLKIKVDTFRYYITALKAKCWITNESITRALNFKGRDTFYFCTTHTALPKYCGADAKKEYTFTSLNSPKYDCTCAQSEAEKEIQLHEYGLTKEQIIICGYPKNDTIANHTNADVQRIRRKLRIYNDKKLILYAPTFREKFMKERPLNLQLWKERLGDEYILLYRAHHAASFNYSINDNLDFVIDASSYPDNTELLIVADILISDYSGIFFEFGVQEKPMFCYAYDYEDYQKYRGLYVDLAEELPCKMNEEDLLEYISKSDSKEIMCKVNLFRKKYISEFGNATSKCLEVIYNNTKVK